MNQITLVTPFVDYGVDFDGDESEGQRFFTGRLNIDQILKVTEEPAYAERAVMIKRDAQGEIVQVNVSYSETKGERPKVVNPDEPNFRNWEGSYFDDDHDRGRLAFSVEFRTLIESPVL